MKPCLLIASPQMSDPFFEGSLVFLWHHDASGAIGVVVNRPGETRLVDVVRIEASDDLDPYKDVPVYWGGPVDSGSATVIARGSVLPAEGWNLRDELAVTRSQESLERLMHQRATLKLCVGYAGWGPGQLEKELEQGGWLWTDLSRELVFHADPKAAYDAALATLGLTRYTVWMQPINE